MEDDFLNNPVNSMAEVQWHEDMKMMASRPLRPNLLDQAMLDKAIALSCYLPNQWADARIEHCQKYLNGEVDGKLGEFGELLRSLEGLEENVQLGLVMGWLKWGSDNYYTENN